MSTLFSQEFKIFDHLIFEKYFLSEGSTHSYPPSVVIDPRHVPQEDPLALNNHLHLLHNTYVGPLMRHTCY